MSDEDFDIPALSSYLHLTSAQVTKLADRGKIPGRKVAGRWRFSQAEIHHWLEQRIGGSDAQELARMEDALERSAELDEEVSITRMLPLEAIAVPLAAKTRQSVIRSMVELAAGTHWLWDPDKMAEAVRSREDMQSTALENGVALLHPRRPMSGILERGFLALGLTGQGIPFGSGRSGLTDVFFLICSVDDRMHLRILARISRLIGSAEFMSQLREAPDAPTAQRLIQQREEQIVG